MTARHRHVIPRFARNDRVSLLGLVLLLTFAGCKVDDVPNFTAPSSELLELSPTPSSINTAVQGLAQGSRGSATGYAETPDIFARNAYDLDASNISTVNAQMTGPLDGGGFGTGLGWATPYRNIRLGFIILRAVDGVGAAMTDAQKEGIRGYVKTTMAYDFHGIIRTHDMTGAPIAVDIPRSDPPAPIVTNTEVYAYIVQLLEEAKAHLASAGPTFSFKLTSGFAGFNTPTTFTLFNRALKARVDVDMGNYAAALVSLQASFLNAASPTLATLNTGVYHTFSAAAGDATNSLFDPTGGHHLAHPSLETDAQLTAAGGPDARYVRKVTPSTARTVSGITSNRRFLVYNTNDARIPYIRNEELILMRAEANIGLGTPAGRAAALADLNLIRTVSGGLAPIAAVPGLGGTYSGDLLLDELLYNKRYSLVYEYGQRWVDLRKYKLLAKLPKALPTHKIFDHLPIPATECSARVPAPPGCAQVNGV
jgi:hypothetical protein